MIKLKKTATKAEAGMVKIQLITISLTIPHLIAERRLEEFEPMIAEEIT